MLGWPAPAQPIIIQSKLKAHSFSRAHVFYVSDFFFLFAPCFVIRHTATMEALNLKTLEAKKLSLKKSRDERGRKVGEERKGWKEKYGNPDRSAVSCWTSLHLPHLFTPVLIKSTEMRIFPSCATYFPPRSPLAASLPCRT